MGQQRAATRGPLSTARSRRAPILLLRRGFRHGLFRPPASAAGPGLPAPGARERAPVEQLYREGRPIVLRGWLDLQGAAVRAQIERSRREFDRLRGGAEFGPLVARRLAAGPARMVGCSEDVADPLEIEKVHLSLPGPGGKDLFAKLSWIADDERDLSLRIRFSFGLERALDWRGDVRRSRAADRAALLAYPEGRALARHPRLLRLLGRLCGGEVRLSERILYNNAPGGGASFHHDAEPGQLGVLYGQFLGRTAWLALPRAELAQEIARLAPNRALARDAFRLLEHPDEPRLERLLNRDRRLTRALVARGALIVLGRGDALILPSPSREVCAWHAVFALGKRPSLAHSYGIFRVR